MAALFPRTANTTFGVVCAALITAAAVVTLALMAWVRTPQGTGQFDPVQQPVMFDHRHHVSDEGIDCRYCHSSVERAPSAGIPSTARCMGCHGQIWNESPVLAMVRSSYATGRPIPWIRVHRLPDFVYFDHSIHVTKGVGCESCHGRVDQMASVDQQAPLTMGWCLSCHRNPAPHLRPASAITAMGWRPPGDRAALGRELVARNRVRSLTYCTACHR